jgi:hypothetical protein
MDFFEHIDDYINGRLDAEQMEQFSQELRTNLDLAKAVENHDIVESTLDLLLEKDIRSQIDSLKSPQGNNHNTIRTIVILALISIVGLIYYLSSSDEEPLPEQLYAIYFKPYMSSGERGTSEDINQLNNCDQAHYYMTKEDFDLAKIALDLSVENNEVCIDKAYWLLSLYYLKINDLENAKELLNQIITDKKSIYKDQAIGLLKEL